MTAPQSHNALTVLARITDIAQNQPIVVVAIDGRSGAGKSTLASRLAEQAEAVIVAGDDFYGGGTHEQWMELLPAQRAARCIDWQRQRPVLEMLKVGNVATWLPFDWAAFDGRLSTSPMTAVPAPIVILEGAYSARPELADLIDLRVLLDTPETIRREQLRRREGDEYRDQWESVWRSAEDHYFGNIVPPESFDLVIS